MWDETAVVAPRTATRTARHARHIGVVYRRRNMQSRVKTYSGYEVPIIIDYSRYLCRYFPSSNRQNAIQPTLKPGIGDIIALACLIIEQCGVIRFTLEILYVCAVPMATITCYVDTSMLRRSGACLSNLTHKSYFSTYKAAPTEYCIYITMMHMKQPH